MKRTVTISNARDTGPTVDVVLWGERATAFPAEQIHKDSRSSPQIIVFVGTLVRSYADNVSLSGGSSCKWEYGFMLVRYEQRYAVCFTASCVFCCF
uniref:Replication protein A OB domain-containing protein n=1 Tax=Zea mays TaxID=4577 RepID=A0A804MQK6_MAIZE